MLIAVIAVVLTFAFNAAKIEDYQDWQPAEGVVTDVRPARKFKTEISFEYNVDSETYSASVFVRSRWDDKPQVGDVVTVWHDGEVLTRASLSKPEVSLFDSTAPIFVVVPLMIAVILMNRKSEAAQKPKNGR